MSAAKELRERRAQVWHEMRDLLDTTSNDGMSAEDAEKHGRLESELQRLTSDLEARERAEAFEAKLAEPQKAHDGIVSARSAQPYVDEARAYTKAFRSYIKDGMSALAPVERASLQKGHVEMRAQGVATGAAGGFLVPEEFLRRLNERRLAFGGMRGVSSVISTDSGADMPYPSNDDTGNVGAILAENTAVTEQDVTIASRTLKAFTYTSKLVRASYQLLQDSAFDVDSFLAKKFGERLGRIENTHFTTGAGTTEPEGIVTNAVVGVTGATGATTTVSYDALVDLLHSVDRAYRDGARWMLRDATLATVRKLKSTDGVPLWQPSLIVGQPDTLLGHAITVNNDVAAMAANAKSILFGNFADAYLIRDVRGVSVVRLDERYADFLQVGFFAFARLDGQPAGPPAFGAVKAYQNSTT